jgi:hypothetical protein
LLHIAHAEHLRAAGIWNEDAAVEWCRLPHYILGVLILEDAEFSTRYSVSFDREEVSSTIPAKQISAGMWTYGSPPFLRMTFPLHRRPVAGDVTQSLILDDEF